MIPATDVLTIRPRRSRTMPHKAKTNATSTDHVVCDHSDTEMSDSSPRSSRVVRAKNFRHRIKQYVEHNYHDHKHDPVEHVIPDVATTDDDGCRTHKSTGLRGGVTSPFPEKLHELLESASEQGLEEIIGWQPHGRCFVVHKPKEFVEVIMPQCFKQSKLTSFQRQLNLYGFSRLTAGPDRGGYYHELFIRGRVDLCAKMSRIRVKGNGSKAASSPATEPNFYVMEPCLGRDDDSDTLPSPPEDSNHISIQDSSVNYQQVKEFALIREDEFCEETQMDRELPLTISYQSDDEDCSVESSMTPVTDMLPILSAEDDLVGSDVKNTFSTQYTNLPSIVSPVVPRKRNIVSQPGSPMTRAPTVAPPESVCSMDTESEIHSGDQLFFEGLPFHYLEAKDIADALDGQSRQGQENEAFVTRCIE